MADKSVVEIAKERFNRARDANKTLRELAIEDTKFVLGDSENKWQWPEDVYHKRAGTSGKPCLTINVTAQHCNQVINSIRQNRPSAKVSPVDSDGDKKSALILSGMLRAIQAYSNADTAHDTAAEHMIYGGEGYWRVLTEYETPESFDQVITIKPLVNPQLVYIDPDAIEPDRSDAKWGFIFEDMSKEQVADEYGDMDVSTWADDLGGWIAKDTIRRAEYFYCEITDDVLLRMDDGTVILKSKLPEGAKLYEKTVITADGQALAVVAQRDTQTKVWKWCKLLGGHDKPVDERIWPGAYLPIITVVGKETNVNGEIVRKGVVRDLKDSGRMVNYSYSAAVETVALQNKVPYLASAEAIEGFEDIWGAANLENRAYLPYNERDSEGGQLQMPSRQPGATMPTAQVQMLQISVEQMRASSGQQNANFGIKSEAQSGVGIQRLKAQGEIATFHFPDNLSRALCYEAKVILDLIPKLYDTKRVVRILGLDGKETAAMLDPELDVAHMEMTDEVIKAAFNPLVGRYDVVIDTGPSYQTQRQEAADALTSLTKSMPILNEVAGDLVVRSYDFPMADEISERLAKTLPPGLKEDKTKQEIPPKVQQQMQQLQEHSQQLEGALNNASQEVDRLEADHEQAEHANRIAEQGREVDRFKAETERLKLIVPFLDPKSLQELAASVGLQARTTPDIATGPPPEEAPETEQAPQGAFFTPE